MFNNLFSKKETTTKPLRPFLVNDHPKHQFAELPKMPETQLVMLVPRDAWARLPEYIRAYEDVTLAGRFGAEPGDFEWEWVSDPEAVRWWRRNAVGMESLFGIALAVPRTEAIELYGLVEVDENSPFWPEVIPEEAANAMPNQAKMIARQARRSDQAVLAELYREYFRAKRMLTLDEPGQPALRRGTIREVERFRNTLLGLIERATKASLPSEMG